MQGTGVDALLRAVVATQSLAAQRWPATIFVLRLQPLSACPRGWRWRGIQRSVTTHALRRADKMCDVDTDLPLRGAPARRPALVAGVACLFAWRLRSSLPHQLVVRAMGDTLVPLVSNLLLLDAEGKRVAVKYYNDTWCVRFQVLRWPGRPLTVFPCPCLHGAGPTWLRSRRSRRRCSPRRPE